MKREAYRFEWSKEQRRMTAPTRFDCTSSQSSNRAVLEQRAGEDRVLERGAGEVAPPQLGAVEEHEGEARRRGARPVRAGRPRTGRA